MSGSRPSPSSSAREALAALERYQLHLRQLATRRVDAELYHRLSVEMQEIRRCCHEAPALSAPWVALLIAHAELSQALWRASPADAAAAAQERQTLVAHVLDSVRVLQQHCMDLAAPPANGH